MQKFLSKYINALHCSRFSLNCKVFDFLLNFRLLINCFPLISCFSWTQFFLLNCFIFFLLFFFNFDLTSLNLIWLLNFWCRIYCYVNILVLNLLFNHNFFWNQISIYVGWAIFLLAPRNVFSFFTLFIFSFFELLYFFRLSILLLYLIRILYFFNFHLV